ncbi:MAG: HAD family hydrolase [Clostridia bacterium]|jgi:Cof subfamily protein (haloacid dehalogenase superfamily)|nr:HAD family hydrolase [Clostridia bacterium]
MEKGKIKGAVFFDYDGTLTDKNHKIFKPTKATLDSIKKLNENGYAVCLATGRSIKYVPQSGINFDCIVSENGGYTVDMYTKKVLTNKSFSDDVLKEMTEFSDENGFIYVLETSGYCYVNKSDDSLFKKMIGMFNVPHSLFTQINFNGTLNEYKEVNKILMMYSDKEKFKNFSGLFSKKAAITLPDSAITSCDINPIGVSKKDGVEAVCKYYDIPKENTYAFGDGGNDYFLLNSVSHGVAMGVHDKSLEEVSEYITDEVKNEGITKALIHYGII